jgi:hypothetical protein
MKLLFKIVFILVSFISLHTSHHKIYDEIFHIVSLLLNNVVFLNIFLSALLKYSTCFYSLIGMDLFNVSFQITSILVFALTQTAFKCKIPYVSLSVKGLIY